MSPAARLTVAIPGPNPSTGISALLSPPARPSVPRPPAGAKYTLLPAPLIIITSIHPSIHPSRAIYTHVGAAIAPLDAGVRCVRYT